MATESLPDRADVIAFPPVLFGGTLLFALLLRFLFPTPVWPTTAAVITGTVIALAGVAFLLLGFREMIRHKTTINPGGVTTTIVSGGVYRYTRNPMYIALSLFYVGVCIAANAYWGFLLLIPLLIIVQRGIIEREERYLTRKFGDEYLRYKQRVRRWL